MHLTRAAGPTLRTPCALLVLIGLLFTAHARGGITTGVSASAQQLPTVLDVYRHVQAVLRRPGVLYHSTIRTQSTSGPIRTSAIQDLWVDAQRNVARSDLTYTYTVTDPSTHRSHTARGLSTSITTVRGVFTRESPPVRITAAEPQLCHGKQLVAADVVLGCPGPTTRSTTRVQSGQYAGRPAVVLVTSGTTEGEDQNTTTTTHLYLDAGTYLPVASITSGIMDAGKTYPVFGSGRYTHVFVPLLRAPKGFFDPASIGYQSPNVTVGRHLDRLPADFTPYWLGRRFARHRSLPALVINGLDRGDTGGPGYLSTLFYASANHPYGAPVVALSVVC